MAAFVIAHAAFGGGWEWREVASILRERGHDVYTPSLTGHGDRVHLASPDVGLETHIQDIANVVLYEDLHQTVLASQSYGGMVITGVASRVPERIAHLIYMNALVPENGQSAFDLLPVSLRERFIAEARASGEGWRIPPPSTDDDPELSGFERGRSVPSFLRMFEERLDLPAELAPHIRRTYIWSREEQAGVSGVPEIMKPFAENAERDPAWQLRMINSIPSAFVRDPKIIAELFDEAAGSRDSLLGGG
jgi:pimeloyl-ACP methyl ester carboxylesterase